MRRLRLPDALLLFGLLAAWLLCLVLHLSALATGPIAWIPVRFEGAAGPDVYPTVRGFWTGPEDDAPGLAAGDALVAVGDADLRGLGTLSVVARIYQEAGGGGEVPIRFARGDQTGDTGLRLAPIRFPLRKTLVAASFALVGALVFWRTRGHAAGRLAFLAGVFYGLHWIDFWGGPPARTFFAVATFGGGVALGQVFGLQLALAFPEETARRDRFSKLWPWIFLLSAPAHTTWAFGWPLPVAWGQPLSMLINSVAIVLFVGLATQSFRRAGPVGRRQLKWAVFGFWLGFGPAGLFAVLTLFEPQLWWLYELALGLAVVIPFCVLIALTRYNLFDIDRLLTALSAYSVVSVLLLGGLIALVPRVAQALAGTVDPAVSQTLAALGLAAVVWPTQRRVESLVEARFFPERQALERDAQRVREALSRCEKPAELLSVLGERLAALLHPLCAVIYGRAHDAFAPVFAHGRAVAPAFSAEGALVAHLEAERSVVDATRLLHLRRGTPVSEPEHAALQTMGVEVLLPIHLRDQLAAFVALGEKQSGDVFTPTDRALLQSLADKASDELRHFGEAEVYRQERAMAEQLRRYVPGAIAEQLTRGGAELVEGEAEVTVLFVDVRGYTSFSEGRRAAAIFSFVNRYTEAVSEIVREHGGAVVEFNGDGMMTVFGAPMEHRDKERAALRAGREIVAAVTQIEAQDAAGQRLSVGVGIATGEAFVGNIKAVDRYIWSAIGNTTNLAARLQSLTRELEAAIAIDAATRERVGDDARDFHAHPEMRVRGRSQPIDVHALPHRPVDARVEESR